MLSSDIVMILNVQIVQIEIIHKNEMFKHVKSFGRKLVGLRAICEMSSHNYGGNRLHLS